MDDFETIFAAYDEDGAGISPVEALKKEWNLFKSSPNADHDLLLDQILGEAFHLKRFKLDTSVGDHQVREWEIFRAELKHRFRFFPVSGLTLGQLEIALVSLELELAPGNYYRARIQDNVEFHETEMGMPPVDKCGNGRANPSGIPYLYIASDESTALAEVRPHPGDKVSMGLLNLSRPKKIIDLRSPRLSISPFGKEEDVVRNLRQVMVLVQKLSDDLATPYQPRMAHLEYLPTQYLCEYIKKSGYSGVMYRSAVGEGINYVLFSDDDFKCTAVSSIPIAAVKVIPG
ncbi:MAG TPA: RES family NAD+ phosphorylase [bacterium]|nr:RES family NAD+ phosphorylase [bacterium]